jgi:inner membrane protein
MPSPVGHSLMGLVIYRSTGRSIGAPEWRLMALYIFVANAPDLDFLPGLLVGDLSRFHHGPSHSIGFAILFGMICSCFSSKRLHTFVMGSILYFSHVILDYSIQDPSPPYGVPLFWPISQDYYMAPFAFLPKFDYRPDLTQSFLSAVFSFANLMTVATELLLLVPWLIVVSFWVRDKSAIEKSPISARNRVFRT